jgi:hypothetical protein
MPGLPPLTRRIKCGGAYSVLGVRVIMLPSSRVMYKRFYTFLQSLLDAGRVSSTFKVYLARWASSTFARYYQVNVAAANRSGWMLGVASTSLEGDRGSCLRGPATALPSTCD